MKKLIIVHLILLMLLGCNHKEDKVIRATLDIESYHTTIGGLREQGTNDKNQRFDYTIEIVNNGVIPVVIHSVEPLLRDGFAEYVVSEELLVIVDKVIAPSGVLEVNGSIIFNAEDLSKEDVLDLKPFVEDIRILQEQVVEVEM
jgi:uncharacterized lipoprotein NlpE involved in copper resistance